MRVVQSCSVYAGLNLNAYNNTSVQSNGGSMEGLLYPASTKMFYYLSFVSASVHVK